MDTATGNAREREGRRREQECECESWQRTASDSTGALIDSSKSHTCRIPAESSTKKTPGLQDYQHSDPNQVPRQFLANLLPFVEVDKRQDSDDELQ
jgi:hypothetical protein